MCYSVCIYVYNPHICVSLHVCMSSASRSTASRWTWATPWPLTTQESTRFTCSCTRPGDACGTSRSPALKSTPTSNLPATARASSTTTSWWEDATVHHMSVKSLRSRHKRTHKQIFPTACTSINALWSPDMFLHMHENWLAPSHLTTGYLLLCISFLFRWMLKRLLFSEKNIINIIFEIIFCRSRGSNYLVFPQLVVVGIPRSKWVLMPSVHTFYKIWWLSRQSKDVCVVGLKDVSQVSRINMMNITTKCIFEELPRIIRSFC